MSDQSDPTPNPKEGRYYIRKGNPTQIDEIGFQSRLEGKEVRDAICVQRPEGPVFALIAREPLGGHGS